jgi:endonuclease YncB( thermonuclease family)
MYALRQAFTTMLLALACTANAETITGLDDTHTRHKIRLTGIDAPEKRQAVGNVSKQSLAEQVAGQSVAVWIATWCRPSGKMYLDSQRQSNYLQGSI